MKRIFGINNVKLYLLIVFLSLFYGFAFTFSEFYDSPFDGLKDFCILSMQWGVILFATLGLMYLLVLNKYIFSVTFPLLTLACTVLTYFRYTANISLTPMIIDLALVNDARTCLEVFSFQLIFWMVISLCISVLVVYYRWKYIKVEYWYIHLFISLFIIVLTNCLVPSFSRPISERMPYSIYYKIGMYLDEREIIAKDRNLFSGNAVCNSDSLTVVLVVGESLRYDHLQLNGYARNTTPLLTKESNIVSFPNIYTEPCFTHTSIPHMLTRADSIYPERAYNEQSFITLFKQAGYRTSWLANQESVATYVYFMNECDTLIYANSGKSLYIFDKWLDTDLLPLYKEELNEKSNNKFILLHTIGSHWWYNSHYTDSFEVFKPTIKSRVISSCSKEEMINSYDNTVLYTDYVLNEVIDELRSKKAILIFLSDHGESLGEDGYFTHGVDRPILHRPACFVWYSSSFKAAYPEKIESLELNKMKHYRSDFLFHSILDAANIDTQYKEKSFSIFKNVEDERAAY